MQRNEPKKVLAKPGRILANAYRITRAELEDLNLNSENSKNAFLVQFAQDHFAAGNIPFSQFKYDFIYRPLGRIAKQLYLGWKDSQLEKIKNLQNEDLQKLWAISQIKSLLNTDDSTAEAIISAAAQNVGSFVVGVATAGIEQVATAGIEHTANSRLITPIGHPEGKKYFDIFIHPDDKRIYGFMISNPLYLTIHGSDSESNLPLFSNASIALYRLEKTNNSMQFKLVYAELDNEFIYLMAKNQSVPAEVLYDVYFKSPAKQPEPVNFEVLLEAVKKDLALEVQKTPDYNQKILCLNEHCKKYQEHLQQVIAKSLGSLALQRLAVPAFATEEPSDVELLAKALLKGGYNGEDNVVSALEKGGYEKNTRVKIESISPSCAAAILKYQIVATLLEIIENKPALPSNEVLDKFELTFNRNQAELEKLRDSYKTKGFLKSMFWTSAGEGFVTEVLKTLGRAPSQTTPEPAAIPQNR